MRRFSALVWVWMLLPVAASAGHAMRERPVTLQLDVNAEGQVTAAKVMDPVPVMEPTSDGRLVPGGPLYKPLPEELAGLAEKAALKWKFQPISIAGTAMTGRTWAQATLQFVWRKNGNVDIALRYDRNGPFMQHVVAPRYPEQMLRNLVTGALAVEYVVEPDGSIDQVRVLKAFGEAAKHQELFEQAIQQALGNSKNLPLLIDGKAVATRMRIPYIFSVEQTSNSEVNLLTKKAWSAIKLAPRDDQDSTASTPGEAVAVNSPFVPSAG